MLKNKEIRKRAADFILGTGRLYKLAIGVCLCVWFCFVPIVLFMLPSDMLSVYCEPSSVINALKITLFALFIAFYPIVSIPVIGGLAKMAYRMFKGEHNIHITEIFAPFKSLRRYGRVLFGELTVIVKLIAFALPIALFAWAMSVYTMSTAEIEPVILQTLFDILFVMTLFSIMILAILGVWVLLSPFFLVPYLLCKGERLFGALRLSRCIMKGKRIDKLAFTIGFAPLFLLSAATFGMLFVVYTVPVYMIAYMIYAENKTLNYEKNKEEENNGEQG